MRNDVTIDMFFDGHREAEGLYAALKSMFDRLPAPPDLRVKKSQIAVRRDEHAFAWVWIPAKYLRGPVAPMVLSVSLPRKDESPRWKQVVQPSSRHYMHHLEVRSEQDLDAEVFEWLTEAWEDAGPDDRTGMTHRDDHPHGMEA